LFFVQASIWWFSPLPLSPQVIVGHYRQRLQESSGYSWSDSEWEQLWDDALLWTFLASWMDLLEVIPDALLETRYDELRRVWLEPLLGAAARRWGEAVR